MSQQLVISPDLALPLDAATRRMAALGMSGSGKSNLAVLLAEAMFDAGIPWVAIDPKGDWWGVRSSKSGKGPGLPIPIFGGLHGDMRLEPTAGKLIAELVVEQRLTCVIDVSEFDTRQLMWGFLTDFGDTLLRRNRNTLHLFLEECDEYLPQKFSEKGNAVKCLGVWQRLVKRGRFRGIGSTQITQRSASLNKDALYQAEAMIAMRCTGKGDREAIAGWVEHNNASAEIVASLPTLQDGEGWFSSPAWLRKTVRARFNLRRTFDSGATPVMLKGSAPVATLVDVDLKKLEARMAETIARAKADDPAELRKQVAELKKQLASKPAAMADPKAVDRAVAAAIATRDQDWKKTVVQRDKLIGTLKTRLTKISELTQLNGHAEPGALPAAVVQAAQVSAPQKPALPQRIPEPRADYAKSDAGGLGKAERAILGALYWLRDETAGPAKVGFFADYSSRSSTFQNAIGRLRTLGLVRAWSITAAGVEWADQIGFQTKPSGEDLREHLRAKLGRAENAILDVLCASHPARLSQEQIADASGYSAGSSTFQNAIGKLRTLEAAAGYERDGGTKAADVFFE